MSFKLTYHVHGATQIRWQAQWWSDDAGGARHAEGMIEDAHLLAAVYRVVIERMVEAIDAG